MNTAYRLPTLEVRTEHGTKIINATDYDPERHTLVTGQDAPQEGDEATPPAPIAPEPAAPAPEPISGVLVEAQGEPHAPAGETTGIPVLAQGEPHAPTGETVNIMVQAQGAEHLFVSKKGKKFQVVGGDGKPVQLAGIDADGYGSEQAAWDAIIALKK